MNLKAIDSNRSDRTGYGLRLVRAENVDDRARAPSRTFKAESAPPMNAMTTRNAPARDSPTVTSDAKDQQNPPHLCSVEER